jgi:hypothetical protein
MRILKPLFAAAVVLAMAVPALASAEPSWGQSGGYRDGGYRDGGYRDGGYDHDRSDRGDYGRIQFLREREFERQRAMEHARWEWRRQQDGYRYEGYRGW